MPVSFAKVLKSPRVRSACHILVGTQLRHDAKAYIENMLDRGNPPLYPPCTADGPQTIPQPAPSDVCKPLAPSFADSLLGSHIMLSQGAMPGGGGPIANEEIKEVGDRVFGIILANTQTRSGRGFIPEEFDAWYENALYKGNRNNPSADAILNYLLGEYKIEETNEGGYRVANQLTSIKEASSLVDSGLPGAQSLGAIFKIGEGVFNELWENSTHVIYDRESRELRLAGRTKGKHEDSPYLEWALPKYVYEEAIRRFVEEGLYMFPVDLKVEYGKYKKLEKLKELKEQGLSKDKMITALEKFAEPEIFRRLEDLELSQIFDTLEEAWKTFIDPSSVENDMQVFLLNPDNPGKIVVGVYVFTDQATKKDYADDRRELRRRSIRGVFSASNRLFAGDSGINMFNRFPSLIYRPPLSPNASDADVAVSLHSNILRPIAQKISMIVAREGNREGKPVNVKKIWDSELKSVQTLEDVESVSLRGLEEVQETHLAAAIPVNGKETEMVVDPDGLAPKLFDLVKRKSKMKRYGIFEIGRISTPASNLAVAEKDLLADALNWKRRGREDMRTHLENAHEIIIAFLNGKPVSFYSGQELDFNNANRQEKLLGITGVMNNPDFHGYRMQAFVTGLSMLRSWWRQKLFGGFFSLFKAPYVIMRTRTEWTAVDFIDHFGSPVYSHLSGRDLNRATEFLRHMDGDNPCDENGVVRDAYTQPLRDPDKDAKIMEKLRRLKPKLHARVSEAFKGLTEHDARVFQGKLTLWYAIKFWLYVHVIFPWRNRNLKNPKV